MFVQFTDVLNAKFRFMCLFLGHMRVKGEKDWKKFRKMRSDVDEKMEKMETVLPFVPLP